MGLLVHHNFYLDKPASENETYVMHFVTVKGKRNKYMSGIKVLPKFWNANRQELRTGNKFGLEYNQILQKQKNELCQVILDGLNRNQEVNKAYVTRNVSFLQPQLTGSDFLGVFEQFIEARKTEMATNTIKNYQTTLVALRKFITGKRIQLDLNSIDYQFYDRFIEFLYNDLDLNNNGAGSIIKNLKVFMSWAEERGLHQNSTYTKFKVPENQREIYPLTLKEYKLIEDLKLKKPLSVVRDVFMLECYTGLRFSDIIGLKKDNFRGKNLILTIIKTRQQITIPLIPQAMKILEKYTSHSDQNIFPPISNQFMNRSLKVIGEMALPISSVVKVSFKGSSRIESSNIIRSQLLSTHTGRQSFITNSLLLKIPTEVVMKMVGHKKHTTMTRYIKITEENLSREMLAWEQT